MLSYHLSTYLFTSSLLCTINVILSYYINRQPPPPRPPVRFFTGFLEPQSQTQVQNSARSPMPETPHSHKHNQASNESLQSLPIPSLTHPRPNP